jgi:sigma-B regulation protein RsbU (phosphoserine phosphatase)
VRAELLQQSGSVLGVRYDVEYRVHRLDIKPGETLLIYSDGVTEAMDSKNVQYDTERMNATVERTLMRHAEKPGVNLAEIVVRELHKDVSHYRGAASVHDDTTMVCLHRL